MPVGAVVDIADHAIPICELPGQLGAERIGANDEHPICRCNDLTHRYIQALDERLQMRRPTMVNIQPAANHRREKRSSPRK